MTTNAAELRAEALKLRDEAVALSLQSNELGTSNFALSRQLIAQAKAKLDQADAFARQANLSENSGGTASSGQVVAQEAQARSDNAAVQILHQQSTTMALYKAAPDSTYYPKTKLNLAPTDA